MCTSSLLYQFCFFFLPFACISSFLLAVKSRKQQSVAREGGKEEAGSRKGKESRKQGAGTAPSLERRREGDGDL
uniref:hypothetical protein 34 n=1 Tax=Moniliophthora perniciosa TaxID=153609 RepID=UPI000024237B|nr:hypothetical protein 34 [Moniliophthora perniciosa]AAQ74324.1 hypothetical protein 34 [Moniliophthora perniciosa]